MVLSSMHHAADVEGDNQKPSIIHYYNSTKSGVDNLDHMVTLTSCKRRTNRWPMVLFFNMLDVAGVASYIVWMANNPQWMQTNKNGRRRAYLMELGKSLVIPHLTRRSQTPQLVSSVRSVIDVVQKQLTGPRDQPPALGNAPEVAYGGARQEAKRKRCHLCDRTADKKVNRRCSNCSKPVCAVHSVVQHVCECCI